MDAKSAKPPLKTASRNGEGKIDRTQRRLVSRRDRLPAPHQGVLRFRRQRHGRFRRSHGPARLHRQPRRHGDLAAAVLSLADARRRLRHRRLPRDQPVLTAPCGISGVSSPRPTSAVSASSSSWSSTTPRTSIAGSSAPVRRKPGSAARDYYVWSDTDKLYSGTRIIFIDTEQSNWTWDPVAKAFFWHRFYSHQPDLNFDNPRVMEEVKRLLHFWLDIGVDGLRLDAIPYLVERDGTNNENLPETHAVLKELRARARCQLPRPHAARRGQPVAGGHPPLFRRRRRMPHGVPLPADAAHVHGARPGGPPSGHRHHPPDAGYPGQLPVGDLPQEPRRADAGDGHRGGARLPVAHLRRGFARPHQSRHPPPPGAAARQRPPQDRADERRCSCRCPARRSSTTATSSAWATTTSSATATACARPCSGRPTATAASRAPTRSSSTCRRSWTRSTASRRSTSRPSRTRPPRCSTGCAA